MSTFSFIFHIGPSCQVKEPIRCAVPACFFPSCPAYPKATCVSFCACKSEYYYRGRRVNCSPSKYSTHSLDKPITKSCECIMQSKRFLPLNTMLETIWAGCLPVCPACLQHHMRRKGAMNILSRYVLHVIVDWTILIYRDLKKAKVFTKRTMSCSCLKSRTAVE